MRRIGRILAILVLATIAWVVVGYLATMPLGAVFGWSGHPAIPAAPVAVYILLYGVLFPALAIWVAWRLVTHLAVRRR